MLSTLTADERLLFTARVVRLFGYGSLAVILVLYLAAAGLDHERIGLLLTFTLLGDTAISLWLTTRADRFGRRRTLLIGAGLLVLAGAVFASTTTFPLLLAAAIVGVISPSGNEVGPFLAIEQAALSEVVGDKRRTRAFAWYALIGSFGTAAGSLAAGGTAALLQRGGWTDLDSYRAIVAGYAAVGLVLALLFALLSPAVEASRATAIAARHDGARTPWHGLHRSRGVVLRLSALFGLDAFGGGFIVQSILAYWFHVRFGLQPAALGVVFFWSNLLNGLSALVSARIAGRIGLVRTMVFTHLPANVMLFFIPLMPNAAWAIGLWLVRCAISAMDVPARQSYTMAVVVPAERAAAAGVTGVTRTIGAALAPVLATSCLAYPALLNVPLFSAAVLKIVYDLALYRSFASLHAPEERPQQRVRST